MWKYLFLLCLIFYSINAQGYRPDIEQTQTRSNINPVKPVSSSSIPKSTSPHKQALLEFMNSNAPIHPIKSTPLSNDMKQWRSKLNLAAGLHTERIEMITLPIHVNILTIGLDGTGAFGIQLSTPQLESWFEHLEHEISQTLVDTFVEAQDGTPGSETMNNTNI
jgi:hypothetical protein